uniref:ATP synthase subunit a n=1 Tax=Euphysa aurata TaxID=576745 RepID=A0A0S2IBI0_9CNID|nr:ATP synthase F0 subunit 6 [Euphysa aurata]
MASYFDHFIVTKIFSLYITDYFLIIISVILIYFLVNKTLFIIPSNYQIILEKIHNHWEIVLEENLGKEFNFLSYPLFSLFSFILGINLLGFFMFTFSPTTHISFTFGFAFFSWLGIIILGFYGYGYSYLSIFMPSGAPLSFAPLLVIIELASHISRPVALGMRLAANLTAGHILLAILSDFGSKMLFISYSWYNLFPIFIIIFMIILEIGVLVIQAYVFTLLLMIYLKDSLILH